MAGGWASALGAAILGGNQGYQEAKVNQNKNLLNAIQLKMAQDQLNELPKHHAEDDIKNILALQGPELGLNNPALVNAANIAGTPLVTKPVPSFLDSTKLGPGGMVNDTRAAEAARQGIAPDTGVVLPTDLILKSREQQLGLQRNQFINAYLKDQMGSMGGSQQGMPQQTPQAQIPDIQGIAPAGGDDPTFPNGVKQYVVKLKGDYQGDNMAARAELQKAWPSIVQAHPGVDQNKVLSNFPVTAQVAPQGTVEPPFENPQAAAKRRIDKLTGLDTGETQHESAAHKVYVAEQEGVAKAQFKPPAAALQRESEAYAKARLLIPKLRESLMTQVIDPNDPTGQQANPLRMGVHMAANAGKNAAYNAGYPLSDAASKAQQLSGLLTIVGATPYMQGSRSMQMFTKAAQHLTDPSLTPEARIQRLNELEEIFPEFEKAMPSASMAYQNAMQQMTHQQQQPPAAAAPGASSKNRTMAEVTALANMTKQDPKSIIQQVIAAGGTVTK